ncbi:outer membrane protein assembly factor BamE [Silanimonas lenta]|uniref:outer membrane protein assembly factor BamE n=1 Tax=Silanimonas lenta TaxID=265429 RepID=UPI000417E94E|nr:outer membrane protein assembly factor BamE [Silanimonas lenta]
MRRLLLALAIAAPVLLTGCLYRQPVFQGNLLEERNVAQLEAGMSKRQVFLLLGSPSVADPFRQNRWDYVSSEQRGHGKPEVKVFTVHFEGDQLVRWEGEFFPEADSAIAREQVQRFGPNLARDKDKRRGR